jgi:hypothetical protein
MNFEPGYLENDEPGAIFPLIRTANYVLGYSPFWKGALKKTNWQFFVESREFSNFANLLSRNNPKAGTFLGASVRFPSNPCWHTSSLNLNRNRLASADLHRDNTTDMGRAAPESESKWRRNEGKDRPQMTRIRSRGTGVRAPKLPERVPSELSRDRLWFS